MSIDRLKEGLPAYAKDLKLNLGNVTTSTALSPRQVWGAMVASALASRNKHVIGAIVAEASGKLSPEELQGAKAAAAIMAMNNIYYRSAHLLEKPDYLQMPARLRMSIIANPGVEKLDFELWSLAVSAVNGCGMCLAAHEKEVLGKGATKEGVQDALRIAAVVHAVSVVLENEEAIATDAETAGIVA